MTEYEQAKIEAHENLSKKASEIIDFYRGLIIDAVESDVTKEQWAKIRPRLLKAMGDRGLEKKILDLLEQFHDDNRG